MHLLLLLGVKLCKLLSRLDDLLRMVAAMSCVGFLIMFLILLKSRMFSLSIAVNLSTKPQVTDRNLTFLKLVLFTSASWSNRSIGRALKRPWRSVVNRAFNVS